LLEFVQTDAADSYIVATEAGILHEMQKKCPQKTFIPAPVEDDTCACSECAFMKLNTLEKLYNCLRFEQPEIELAPDLIEKAKMPILKMLALK
jgi:quinolinate synthase